MTYAGEVYGVRQIVGKPAGCISSLQSLARLDSEGMTNVFAGGLVLAKRHILSFPPRLNKKTRKKTEPYPVKVLFARRVKACQGLQRIDADILTAKLMLFSPFTNKVGRFFIESTYVEA